MKGRPEALENIAGKKFDVCVSGGGATGAGSRERRSRYALMRTGCPRYTSGFSQRCEERENLNPPRMSVGGPSVINGVLPISYRWPNKFSAATKASRPHATRRERNRSSVK